MHLLLLLILVLHLLVLLCALVRALVVLRRRQTSLGGPGSERAGGGGEGVERGLGVGLLLVVLVGPLLLLRPVLVQTARLCLLVQWAGGLAQLGRRLSQGRGRRRGRQLEQLGERLQRRRRLLQEGGLLLGLRLLRLLLLLRLCLGLLWRLHFRRTCLSLRGHRKLLGGARGARQQRVGALGGLAARPPGRQQVLGRVGVRGRPAGQPVVGALQLGGRDYLEGARVEQGRLGRPAVVRLGVDLVGEEELRTGQRARQQVKHQHTGMHPSGPLELPSKRAASPPTSGRHFRPGSGGSSALLLAVPVGGRRARRQSLGGLAGALLVERRASGRPGVFETVLESHCACVWLVLVCSFFLCLASFASLACALVWPFYIQLLALGRELDSCGPNGQYHSNFFGASLAAKV